MDGMDGVSSIINAALLSCYHSLVSMFSCGKRSRAFMASIRVLPNSCFRVLWPTPGMYTAIRLMVAEVNGHGGRWCSSST